MLDLTDDLSLIFHFIIFEGFKCFGTQYGLQHFVMSALFKIFISPISPRLTV